MATFCGRVWMFGGWVVQDLKFHVNIKIDFGGY